MKLNVRYFLLCCAMTISTLSLAMVPYVDPQPGENLWGLVSREGIAIDYLLDQQCSCTTIDAIYALAQNINEIVDGCCRCTYFIGQADIPMVITNHGYYCLTEDVMSTSTAIIITGTDIVLDLQGHRISCSNGDAVSTGLGTRVMITGGSVVAPNGAGVNAGGSGNTIGILVENMEALGCGTGFYAGFSAWGIQYKGCTASFNTLNGFYHDLRNKFIHTYKNCTSLNNQRNGFKIDNLAGSSETALNFMDCTASGNGQAGFLFGPFNGLSLSDCTALQNGGAGYDLRNTVNGFMVRSTAVNNSGAGFTLDVNTGSLTCISCLANSNFGPGFRDLGSNASVRNRLFNNYSKRNAPNYDLGFGLSQAVIISPTDIITTNGLNISWWANMDGGT